MTLAGSGNFAISTVSGAGGGLTMLGSGIAQLSGVNNYTGPTITDGGTLQLTSGGLIGSTLQYVGSANTASFVQSAGSVAASTVYVGYTATGSGSYTLSGGSLLASAASVYVGVSGSGSFTVSGGNAITSLLYAGSGAGATSNLNVSSGSLFAFNEYIGYYGKGNYSLTGAATRRTRPSTSVQSPVAAAALRSAMDC